LSVVGTLGILLGLLPSLLIKLMDPQMSMVDIARAGLWITVVADLPKEIRGRR